MPPLDQDHPVPDDEALRLAALRAYDILDSDFEPIFDKVAQIAAAIFGAPVSLVSLVDDDRQWFKAAVGTDLRQTPRAQSFCSRAILARDVLDVPDAEADPRFSANPLVTGKPHIRSYAGAPLMSPEGYPLGTVCVIGDRARPPLPDDRRALLKQFAELVVLLMEERRRLRTVSERVEHGAFS